MVSAALRDELAEQFNEVASVNIEDLGLTDTCLSICQTYGLSAEDLAIKWEAFSMRNEGGSVIERKALTLANLDDFRAKVLSKLRVAQPQFMSKGGRGASVTRETLHQFDARKRTRDSAVAPDIAFGTPAGAGARGGDEAESPLTSGPSSQYVERKNAGKIETTLNPELGIRAAGRARTRALEVDTSEWHGAEGIGRHMWERLEDKAAAIDKHAHDLGMAICASAGLDAPGNVMRATVDETTAVGRICCDSEGKVNPQSVFLETTRASSAGVRIKLELSDLPDFVIFRGQVVAVRGTNARGHALAVRAIHSCAPRPPPAVPAPPASSSAGAEGTGGARVLVACGPYTTADSLGYGPLLDLLAAAERHVPDAIVLLGPFVDEAHPSVKAAALGALTFESLFREKVVDVLHAWLDKQRANGRTPPTIVLAPSCSDVHAHPTFPQAPLDARGSKKGADPSLLSVRNPATVSIGGYVFALTSADAIKALGAEECARVSLPPSQREDRMTRLCRQVVEQRVFMPVYPPPRDLPVDTTLSLGDVGSLPVTPHVLILASELNNFAKAACGVVCVNPGRLVKHMQGGTYALIQIHPHAPAETEGAPAEESTSVVPRTCVQVIRI